MRWPVALFLGLALSGADLAAPQPPQVAGSPAATAREAVRLYDLGRYAEARALFEQLEAAGALDGPLLYRYAFCLRQAREAARERQVLERAVQALQAAAATDTTLESSFYLENAYRNLGRLDEARRVAEEAVRAVERGERQVAAEDAVESFRLGKLYDDLGRDNDAARWYDRAVAALDPQTYPSYVRWARGYLARRALARTDYVAAELHFSLLAQAALASRAELDQLALVRVRLGDYAGAREAWRQGERLDPPDANRERYCWHLADLADQLGTLPERAPDGRHWSALTKEELEALLLEQAARVREIQQAARGQAADAEQRQSWRDEIRRRQGVFVAAGLEYVSRDPRTHPIRETAFFGGYAPLIFKPAEWELPEPDKGRFRGDRPNPRSAGP